MVELHSLFGRGPLVEFHRLQRWASVRTMYWVWWTLPLLNFTDWLQFYDNGGIAQLVWRWAPRWISQTATLGVRQNDVLVLVIHPRPFVLPIDQKDAWFWWTLGLLAIFATCLRYWASNREILLLMNSQRSCTSGWPRPKWKRLVAYCRPYSDVTVDVFRIFMRVQKWKRLVAYCRSYSDVTVDVFRIFMRVQQCMFMTVIFAFAIFRRN